MTIEATLERIADALEILAGSAPPVAAAPAEETPAAPKAKKPTAAEKKKAAAAAAAEEKTEEAAPAAEEKTEEAAPEAAATQSTQPLTIEGVREALKALQKLTNAATAKGVLSDFGVSTLSELDESTYADVIAAAEAAADDA